MGAFKVAIVGGSVAGLALALHLEKFGIDFVVLEAYSAIAPQVGASIGLAPNGLKICQQLGCYEDIKDVSVAVANLVVRNGDGDVLWEHRLLEETRKQHGYEVLFTERQKFLKAFYSNIQDQSKLLVDHKVVKVEQVEDKVQLHTTEGGVFQADIAIGADGVHSFMRQDMWRLAEEAGSDVFGDNPGTDVKTDYGCVFGISSATGDLEAGYSIHVHKKDRMVMIVVDDEDWFDFFKLPETHHGLDLPRYTKQDETEILSAEADTFLTDTTTFGQVYKNVKVAQMRPTPYHCFDRWHYGRIMTIGDSSHKMSAIAGQGGCTTLEGCVALVDELHIALEANEGHLTTEQVDDVFTRATQTCKKRANWMVWYSETYQRAATWSNRFYAFVDSYVVPLASTPFLVSRMFMPCEGSYISKTLPPPQSPVVDESVSVQTEAASGASSWMSAWFSTTAKVEKTN